MIFFYEQCKNSSPYAAPVAIFSRLSHDSGSIAELPEQQNPSLEHFITKDSVKIFILACY